MGAPGKAIAAMLLAAALGAAPRPAAGSPEGPVPDLKPMEALAEEWFRAPDEAGRRAVEAKAAALPPLPEEAVKPLAASLLAAAKRNGPKLSLKSKATFYEKPPPGVVPKGKPRDSDLGLYLVAGPKPKGGLLIAMHGGGDNAGDAGSAMGIYSGAAGLGLTVVSPQAMRLVSSAWNEEEEERFVLDLVDAACRTLDVDRHRIYLAGHSMGGDGSWMIGGRNADRIAAASPLAGSVMPYMHPGSPNKVATPVAAYEGLEEGVLPNLLHMHYWIYHSADDPNEAVHPDDIAVEHLKALQARFPGMYDFKYDRTDGMKHALPKGGVKPILEWMVKQERVPYPAEVVWETKWGWKDRFHWLRCGALVSGFPWRFHAKVVGPNHVEVTGTTKPTAGRTAPKELPLQVLLSPRLVDLSKPILVTSRGAKLHEGPVARSFAALLASIAPRNDPEEWFEASVEVKVPRSVWWDLWEDDPNAKR